MTFHKVMGVVSMPEPTEFGCERCWPDSPEAASQASHDRRRLCKLIDESHFQVSLLQCPHCDQQFIYIFTETIDWRDGDDPACRTTTPITQAEAAGLSAKGESLTEQDIERLAPTRRSLLDDYPKGGPRAVMWGAGVIVRFHD